MRSLASLALILALILGPGALADARASDVPPPAPPGDEDGAIEIVVEDGYHPDRIVVPAGRTVRLAFTRKEYTGCTLEVVFPTLDQHRQLPTGERFVVDLGTPAKGEIPFHCGMNMIHGVVVVGGEE